jgi:hypothetical protein
MPSEGSVWLVPALRIYAVGPVVAIINSRRVNHLGSEHRHLARRATSARDTVALREAEEGLSVELARPRFRPDLGVAWRFTHRGVCGRPAVSGSSPADKRD